MFGVSQTEFNDYVDRKNRADLNAAEDFSGLRRQVQELKTVALEARGRSRHAADDVDALTQAVTELSRKLDDIGTKLQLLVDYYSLEYREVEAVSIPAHTVIHKRK